MRIFFLFPVPANFKKKFSAQTVHRGETIEFNCDAYGEQPVSITISKDRMLLDFDNDHPIDEQTLHTDSRYQLLRKYKLNDAITSYTIRIINIDHRDSSLFTCQASNAYGKDEYNFQVIVQGLFEIRIFFPIVVILLQLIGFDSILLEPPSRPENVHLIEIESRNAIVSWSHPYAGNSPILSYHIEYRQYSDILPPWHHLDEENQTQQQPQRIITLSKENGGNLELIKTMPSGTIFRQTISGTENSITLRSLKPMTTYEIRVQAENKLGNGPFQMPPLKITTKEEGIFFANFSTIISLIVFFEFSAPSGPPLNIHVYPLSAHSLQVTFQAPKNEHQNGQLLGYYVGYKAADIDEHFMFKKILEEKSTISSNQNNQIILGQKDVKITDLRRATKYLIIVQAFNR